MNTFVSIEPFKTFGKVRYYTFWVEGRDRSEADSFFSKFENDMELANDLNLLVAWLSEIGDNRGARARYFRQENSAEALPPPARIMSELSIERCDLRLYCVRLSEEVVILANGGRKTSRSVQDSPDAWPKFQFANKMARQLLELMQNGSLNLNMKTIENLDEIELWT